VTLRRTLKDERYEWLAKTISLSIALQVQGLRGQRGWSQAELGRRAGLQQPVIARVESGRWCGQLRILKAIARACDVALEVRFEEWGRFLASIGPAFLGAPIPSFEDELAAQGKVESQP
jgi:HTH-type transcriptional regulator/antitoxin HipB